MPQHDLQREPSTNPSLTRRLLWFAAIWLASIATLTVVATLIRWAIRP